MAVENKSYFELQEFDLGIFSIEDKEKSISAKLNDKLGIEEVKSKFLSIESKLSELSKFQILCKIPFPYLGDKVVGKKINKWKWWYDLQTTRTVIQSVGRSIRSEDDEAITYILDSDGLEFILRIKFICLKTLLKAILKYKERHERFTTYRSRICYFF